MTANRTRQCIHNLGRSMLLRDGAGLTDAELLERFLQRQEEQYFAALIARHKPMIWGVCCRHLWNRQDAEDAFQETLRVLYCKASSINPKRGTVAGWLHGVATRAALVARRSAARRSRREKQVARIPEPTGREDPCTDNLQYVLDEELLRLPEIHRAVVVLCCLEGKTRKEAAQELGEPEGTVASRLARARELLETRLTRRGLAVSGVLTAAFWQEGASASTAKSLAVKASTTIALADSSLKISLCNKWLVVGLLVLASAGTAGGIAVSNRVVCDVWSDEATQMPAPSLSRPARRSLNLHIAQQQRSMPQPPLSLLTPKDPKLQSDQTAAEKLATMRARLATIAPLIKRDVEKIVVGSRADGVRTEVQHGTATIELRYHMCPALWAFDPIYDIRISYGIQEGKMTLEYRTKGSTCWRGKDYEKPIYATLGDPGRGPEWLVLGRSEFHHIKALLDELHANVAGCR